ncbi:MAG: NAD kinase [Actinobacteria bacterium]|jgi:NAD+ kinase|nr:NAD kinase [Actinomycetota bacterium]
MTRSALLVSNAQSAQQASLVERAAKKLSSRGIHPLLEPQEVTRIAALGADLSNVERFSSQQVELGIVLGGDGSILRAAELLRGQQSPILGINTGHVGFMAEAELDELAQVMDRVAAKDYEVGHRSALEVEVIQSGKVAFSSWAMNEVTVEKSARERMLELVVEVDKRPLSSFGCDGILVSTPTGSTAYAFSAGGPVVWPDVDALLVVPLSAHSLFARPLVLGSNTHLAFEVLKRSPGNGVLWCDGRRTFDLGPGARIEVRRSQQPVPMVLLSDATFTDRLVRKFALPVTGWRGPEENK